MVNVLGYISPLFPIVLAVSNRQDQGWGTTASERAQTATVWEGLDKRLHRDGNVVWECLPLLGASDGQMSAKSTHTLRRP